MYIMRAREKRILPWKRTCTRVDSTELRRRDNTRVILYKVCNIKFNIPKGFSRHLASPCGFFPVQLIVKIEFRVRETYRFSPANRYRRQSPREFRNSRTENEVDHLSAQNNTHAPSRLHLCIAVINPNEIFRGVISELSCRLSVSSGVGRGGKKQKVFGAAWIISPIRTTVYRVTTTGCH